MIQIAYYILLFFLGLLILLICWRLWDAVSLRRTWNALLSSSQDKTCRFSPDMIADLPEPARRYFTFAIKPGTRLSSVVELTMQGDLGLGTKDAPNYMPMTAHQLLAPPSGFIWKLRTGGPVTILSGSDGMYSRVSWVKFWLVNLLPVVRVGGSHDHLRASFGRVAGEAAFWCPAALLPGPGVSWAQTGPDTARVTITHGTLSQEVDITVDKDGQPTEVSFQRWTDANKDKRFRLQPFGGIPSNFQSFDGYRIATYVEGGNNFGTPAYFPFFKAHILTARFH
ncbi:hypothetical protein GCM10017044_12310 [Kordiimonas sediminis]|uniref:Uncharacterized protein n=1 Tax=Kordiimonas sediminis TaxID=1735581 RepID=A0A919E6M2_9PROT|nr:DUF6544 family protein [Kordiimonas sediminis]GHF19287.1 hypothetical protein GCM10017044_12310 [Kordiimonas sediminis]